MHGPDHRALIEALLPPVLAAGRLQLSYARSGMAVERKADQSPVTAADRESEAILVAALARIAPRTLIAAEEAVAEGRVPPAAGEMFMVDPLDGTRDFVTGSDDFTVNVGLVRDGRPVLGLILAPARGEIYATLGAGIAAMARLDPSAAVEISPGTLSWTPIAARRADDAGLVAVSSPWRPQQPIDDWLAGRRVQSKLFAGSSYKFCLIARGDGDVYPQPGATYEWDTAAGQAILEAAGGRVLTREGVPLGYGKVAAGYLNPPFIAWGRDERGPPSAKDR